MKGPVIVLVLLLLPVNAVAQADVIARARAAAADGDRSLALGLLEEHLTRVPEDVDARLMYGLVLSWEHRYDDARRELQRVLAQAPAYLDARIALMNVEFWSDRRRDAEAQANAILSREPGNPEARLVRERLDALRGTWTANVSYSHDRFSDDRGSWHDHAVSLSRSTPIGPIVVRGTRAARFSRSDEQLEVELYPVLRAGTYAYVGMGFAPNAVLYPRNRVAFDLYQSLGRGLEVSAGYRRLAFDETAHIYVVTLTKYIGTWMTTGKVYHVPGGGSPDSTSYYAVLRRYFGAGSTSFAELGYGRGRSREEARSVGDLLPLADTVRGHVDVAITARWRFQLEATTSRREQARGVVWQTGVGTGLSLRFD
jgi:YaiO family outer membrane protein